MSWQFILGLIVGSVLTTHGQFIAAVLYLNPWLMALLGALFAVLFIVDVTKAINKGASQ